MFRSPIEILPFVRLNVDEKSLYRGFNHRPHAVVTFILQLSCYLGQAGVESFSNFVLIFQCTLNRTSNVKSTLKGRKTFLIFTFSKR